MVIGTYLAVVGSAIVAVGALFDSCSPDPALERRELMYIKILGPGCKNCDKLERATREALSHLMLDATVEKVTDPRTIAGYGVMRTPGLVVDEKVVVSGRVPTVAELQGLLARMPAA